MRFQFLENIEWYVFYPKYFLKATNVIIGLCKAVNTILYREDWTMPFFPQLR